MRSGLPAPHALAELAQARALMERSDFASALVLYQGLLDAELPAEQRHEACSNGAMALFQMARAAPPEPARRLLERALSLVTEALRDLDPRQAAREWVQLQGNMALIHLSRYEAAGEEQDLMLAHLTLDETEQALVRREHQIPEWIGIMRERLVELRARRRRSG